jgi:pimeloyl-ACP methyl ester carboxylesterase
MSAESWRAAKQYAQMLGRRMAYVEQGCGEPIVFLHGNPTSSYLWRFVLAEVVSLGRCIAPDLIGMGDSEKLPAADPARYTFLRHRDFLDALLNELAVTGQVTLVLHDWGSALGFDWAKRNPDRVRAILYMEAIVRPFPDWDAWPPPARSALSMVCDRRPVTRCFCGPRCSSMTSCPAGCCAPSTMTNSTSTAGRSPRLARTGCRHWSGCARSQSAAGPPRWSR